MENIPKQKQKGEIIEILKLNDRALYVNVCSDYPERSCRWEGTIVEGDGYPSGVKQLEFMPDEKHWEECMASGLTSHRMGFGFHNFQEWTRNPAWQALL